VLCLPIGWVRHRDLLLPKGFRRCMECDGLRACLDTAPCEACSPASGGRPVSESVGDSGEEADGEDAGRPSQRGVALACREETERDRAGKAHSLEDVEVAVGILKDEVGGGPGWGPAGRAFALRVDTRQPMLQADRVTRSHVLRAAHPWSADNGHGDPCNSVGPMPFVE
jgi:hypothetical protein